MVTHNPPTISFSVGNNPSNPDGVKDTTHNVKLGHGFTVNIISEPWAELANAACVNSPPEISEWPISGLTKEPSACIPWHVKFVVMKTLTEYRIDSRQTFPCQGERIQYGMRGLCILQSWFRVSITNKTTVVPSHRYNPPCHPDCYDNTRNCAGQAHTCPQGCPERKGHR